MIKEVYGRAQRFYPFSNFEVNLQKLENFKRLKQCC